MATLNDKVMSVRNLISQFVHEPEMYYGITEAEYWKSVFRGLLSAPVPVLPYVPQRRELPARVLEPATAWKGIESVLGDLIETFQLRTNRCLEFGVEYGYSTAALSCFFDSVIGVDTFTGDKHTLNKADVFAYTSKRLSKFENIELVRSDYRDWIAKDESIYDLIHIDIVHSYADTFHCGLWSASHAACVLFHDTLSFPAVRRAVIDIARETGKHFYNLKESYGLGILVDRPGTRGRWAA
jgi:Methyltransferase domain